MAIVNRSFLQNTSHELVNFCKKKNIFEGASYILSTEFQLIFTLSLCLMAQFKFNTLIIVQAICNYSVSHFVLYF